MQQKKREDHTRLWGVPPQTGRWPIFRGSCRTWWAPAVACAGWAAAFAATGRSGHRHTWTFPDNRCPQHQTSTDITTPLPLPLTTTATSHSTPTAQPPPIEDFLSQLYASPEASVPAGSRSRQSICSGGFRALRPRRFSHPSSRVLLAELALVATAVLWQLVIGDQPTEQELVAHHND